ncbi:DUF4157 domain-containing protein [Pedobacter frigidisoli]|uniref:DUF4157 domain-containing protein n=1 Tax=Pedobacter frigidisoli TaxID=2530455 RepID=A0A4R0P7B3_9SPHI|nr:DUF4157 domain-containing protein [Pedobacter frigidisoli]TCD10398.1 DUF4157 domain-containing protein [Pedobacter frigidisoli]
MGVALAYSNSSFKSVTQNRPSANCVQAKLKVGAINDPQEQQADQVAEKVMRMPSNVGFAMGGIGGGAVGMNVQRKCSNCESEEKISRKEEELKEIDQPEILQAKAGASFAAGGTAPISVQSGIAATKGGGASLPSHVSSDLGGKMGADFSGVKIHDNSHAAKMTAHVNARAFTVGNNIYFNQGEYNPNSSGGKFLLAHELTHTIQQGGTVQRKADEKEKVLRKVNDPEKINRKDNKRELQRSTQEPEKINRCACSEEKVQRWDLGEWLADSAWEIVEEIAPAEFVQLLREISNKGILGFLHDKLMVSLNRLFDRFPAVGNFVTNLITVFSMLYERVSVIMQALIAGDCAPLLAAVIELKNVITTIATDAWAGLTDFVRPIGDFFTGLWTSFGAPVVDWLGQTASDVWAWMQGIGQSIWDWTSPVREYGSMAWDWVKSTLGIGSDSGGAENSNGIIQWITGKAEQAWTSIKETVRPVIEPVQQIASKVMEILPLNAIMNLRDTVSNFAVSVNGMATAMGDDGSGVAAQAQQASLRDIILPAVQSKIVEVQQGISNTGLWVAENVGGFVAQITGFYNNVASSSIFSAAAPAIAWINDTALSLGNWVQTGVISLFAMASDGLGYLGSFINPILNALQRIVDTLGDLAGRAGDFILGQFMLIPECIRTPIKNFLIEQILSRIPLFNQIMAIGDVWARAQQIVMTILYQVFVDGNLPGAMWTFFRELLSLVGIPPELVVSILANASQAVVDILGNPVGFFINLLSGLQQGFTQFFGNIGTHLLSGVVNWLTAEMQAMGITPPTDFSFGSIFSFILQILGITIDNIFNLLATRIGEERAQRLRGMLDMATGAWSFVADVVERGPAAIWERIQEQLSNLWDTVIGNIVTFINERIMAQATAWLLSMLDISGIMPVVNSILAVYRAIQSFTEYFVPMLRIINQYVTMLADVARGNIAGAANFLEGILANSLPIMIGFLANQFGFGRIATRMQEILESVKARIDNGILWVIDQAIRIGGAVMDAGRSVRDAVLGWLGLRKGFNTGDGQHHEIYFTGQENNSHLIVASNNPQPLEVKIRARINSLSGSREANAEKIAACESAISIKNEMDSFITSHVASAPAGSAGTQDIQTNIDGFLERIKNQLITGGVDESDIPLSNVTYQMEGGKAKKVTAQPLTKLAGNTRGQDVASGSRPLGWEIANYLNSNRTEGVTTSGRASRVIDWRRVHLLSAILHGPSENWNLTPTTQSANSRLSNIENEVSRDLNSNVIYDKYEVEISDFNPTQIVANDVFGAWNTAYFPSRITLTKQKRGEAMAATTLIGENLPDPDPVTLETRIDYFDNKRQLIDEYFRRTMIGNRASFNNYSLDRLNLSRIPSTVRDDVRGRLRVYYEQNITR